MRFNIPIYRSFQVIADDSKSKLITKRKLFSPSLNKQLLSYLLLLENIRSTRPPLNYNI